MSLIVTGHMHACGRDLCPSDINALDEYVHRCKLGPYRPGRALRLSSEASSPNSPPEKRAKASADLEAFVAAARAELGKLRRIQENRLLQLNQHDSGRKPRLSSGCSVGSTSTVASSSELSGSDWH
mmetsp:Transcript_21153/g.59115  ORF Transcript_21153/g.59115 Transcript_21153/m.59115 type:complete len:126 (+) Transcript_21153:1-378(+)